MGFGLAGLALAPFFIFGILAIVTGHLADRRIRKLPFPGKGGGKAALGLVLGYLSIPAGLGFHFLHFLLGAGIHRSPDMKVVQSLAIAVDVEQSLGHFHSEYGTLPKVGHRLDTNTEDGKKLLAILLGIEGNPETAQNPRGIKFLTVREAVSGSLGLRYAPSGESPEGLFDAWGNPLTVVLNVSNEDALRFTVGSKSFVLENCRVAVFSPGPDKKPGTRDDIATW